MPGPIVVTGGMAMCSFGVAPGTLVALPTKRVNVEGRPALTVDDIKFPVNLSGFSMCTSLANPTVASATSAALGVLTPMPCTPMITGPWQPGAPKAKVGGMSLLTAGSMCTCSYGGVVQVTVTGSGTATAS